MDLKAAGFQILRGSLARRILRRVLFFAFAISIAPLLQIVFGFDSGMLSSIPTRDCVEYSGYLSPPSPNLKQGSYLFSDRFLKPMWGSIDSTQCKENVNLTVNVVRELMDMQMFNNSTKALCVGEGCASAVMALRDLGFSNARGVYRRPFFSLKQKQFVYELDYKDNSFDFVLSRDLDKVSVPALLVLEIERILRPGGIGAMLVGMSSWKPNSLIRSATPVSLLLKISEVVHVAYMNNNTLVVFKKKIENVGLHEQYSLPADCPSITNNKLFIEQMEPLVDKKPVGVETGFAYLPKFVDVSSKKRLVYIDIGIGEPVNSSVTDWFLPSYSVDRQAFNVYFVGHNASIMLSYLKQPGITFVYHPGLTGIKAAEDNFTITDDLDPSLEDEGFDFLSWFKETVQNADFVVLKMNSGKEEMKFLLELFESGAICFVDELFLRSSDHVNSKGVVEEDFMGLFKDLRSSGVFVHQWWGD